MASSYNSKSIAGEIMVNKNDYSVYVLLLYSGPPARTVHFSSIDITQAMGLVSPGFILESL